MALKPRVNALGNEKFLFSRIACYPELKPLTARLAAGIALHELSADTQYPQDRDHGGQGQDLNQRCNIASETPYRILAKSC